MAGFFNRQKHGGGFQDLLNWDGSLDGVDLKTLDRARRELLSKLGRVEQHLDLAMAQARSGDNFGARPARCSHSYRAGMMGDKIVPASLANIKNDTQIAPDTSMYHDSTVNEISVRQVPNLNSKSHAPYGLQTDILGFDGSYLAFSVTLPAAVGTGLKENEMLKVDLRCRSEHSIPSYLRLSAKDGPNVKTLSKEVKADGHSARINFDPLELLPSESNEKIWIDLIFNQPTYNGLKIEEFTIHRTFKAEM